MSILIPLITYIHAAAGTAALLFGLLPICTKKGGAVHKKSGLLYCWSMGVIAVTSLLIFIIKPYNDGRLFLAFIGLFSFYLAFSGARIIRSRFRSDIAGEGVKADLAMAYMIVSISMVMFVLVLINIYRGLGVRGHWNWSYLIFALLYLLFGWFSVGMGREDLRRYSGKVQVGHPHSNLTHLARMLGAYTATVTAFCVVNVSQWFPGQSNVFIWVLPGALGGGLISLYTNRFKKRSPGVGRTIGPEEGV